MLESVLVALALGKSTLSVLLGWLWGGVVVSGRKHLFKRICLVLCVYLSRNIRSSLVFAKFGKILFYL